MASADEAAPALKEIFDRKRLRQIATQMSAVYPQFDAARFLKLASEDLDALSILQRLRRIAESLGAVLPQDFGKSVTILKTLAPRLNHGFVAIVLPEYVALYGQEHFGASMDALSFFTRFGSAEFAIRHFLRRDFPRTLAVMEQWARHENEHVRRLASEGSRPRLPWSARLDELIGDPSHTKGILETLKADESETVRRSVANHLNDITKDHPEWALDLMSSWSKEDPRTVWIVRHALRSLIKKGDPRALAIIGATSRPRVRVDGFDVKPRKVKLGGTTSLSCRLTSTARESQRLVVDYAVHYVKKSGKASRKVFKLKQFKLEPRETLAISRKITLRNFTTRVHYAGRHEVELLVNGKSMAQAWFDLSI
jgi:3-methyladenine DNA glycosylase AlkC